MNGNTGELLFVHRCSHLLRSFHSYLPFLAPCRTSFPTSQSWPRGFFTITWHSGSFRRLVCSIPFSRLLLGSDSSAICPHASEIGSGSAPPKILIRTRHCGHLQWRVCFFYKTLTKKGYGLFRSPFVYTYTVSKQIFSTSSSRVKVSCSS